MYHTIKFNEISFLVLMGVLWDLILSNVPVHQKFIIYIIYYIYLPIRAANRRRKNVVNAAGENERKGE